MRGRLGDELTAQRVPTRMTFLPPQEHVIHVWEETGSRFHNCLIQLYCEKVQSLMKDYLLSLPTGIRAHPKQVAPTPMPL